MFKLYNVHCTPMQPSLATLRPPGMQIAYSCANEALCLLNHELKISYETDQDLSGNKLITTLKDKQQHLKQCLLNSQLIPQTF